MTTAHLYLAYQKEVRALARKLSRTPDEAEELVSATFEVLPKAISNYRGGSAPKAFVLGICANLARHQQRGAARKIRAMEAFAHQTQQSEVEDPELVLGRRQLAEQVLQALERLPPEQRSAFLLVGVEDHSAAEVAAMAGVPEATVRSRLFHARRKLQEALSENLDVLRAAGVALSLVLLLTGTAYAAVVHRDRIVQLLEKVVEIFTASPPRSTHDPRSSRMLGDSFTPESEPEAPLPFEEWSIEELTDSEAAVSVDLPPSSLETRPAPATSPPNPSRVLYRQAHRLHFSERRYPDAVRAWTEYLDRYPREQFSLEARYNRAVALLRIGELDEARKVLEAFAHGAYDGYRRDDASALVEDIIQRQAESWR